MKRARFREEKIMACCGSMRRTRRGAISHASTGSRKRRFTTKRPNTATWMSPRPEPRRNVRSAAQPSPAPPIARCPPAKLRGSVAAPRGFFTSSSTRCEVTGDFDHAGLLILRIESKRGDQAALKNRINVTAAPSSQTGLSSSESNDTHPKRYFSHRQTR
jgi:hypothetical protein